MGFPSRISHAVEECFLDFLRNWRTDADADADADEDADADADEDADADADEDADADAGEPYYQRKVKSMDESKTLLIDFTDLVKADYDIHNLISRNYLYFSWLLRNACWIFAQEMNLELSSIPDIDVGFIGVSPTKASLLDSELGKLVSISGIITLTSRVQMELYVGVFRCLDCETKIIIGQVIIYCEPIICENCSNMTRWKLLAGESTYTDWQMVRIQEIYDEIPAASIPRSVDVILRRDIVDQAKLGDRVVFTGMGLNLPNLTSGVRDLSYRYTFIANSVQISDGITLMRKDYGYDKQKITAEKAEKEKVRRMIRAGDFDIKAQNFEQNNILGHVNIKAAILLMLVGGVPRFINEDVNLRGNINVCIVGDPSFAKSQFLKFGSGLVPNSVYTSGKSSSAAALTAAVAKDSETGEFCIQPGALMLANNGICFIDDFDMIDTQDQVAVHEAMEQQTIRLTKDGITLNARTSILAAVSDAGRRHDDNNTLKHNVALSPAILSSFDLVYHVKTDNPDDQASYHSDSALTAEEYRSYISFAKKLSPKITPEAEQVIKESYVTLRREATAPGSRVANRVTVRQLEALIRLSEAAARSVLMTEVQPCHVEYALRLLKASISNVVSSEIDMFQEETNGTDVNREIEVSGQGEPHSTDGAQTATPKK